MITAVSVPTGSERNSGTSATTFPSANHIVACVHFVTSALQDLSCCDWSKSAVLFQSVSVHRILQDHTAKYDNIESSMHALNSMTSVDTGLWVPRLRVPTPWLRVLTPWLLLLFLGSGCDARESELNLVTCGSLVKLLNTRHNVRLHSHDVKYGSGSGQQSVTGVENADDANSYWRVRGQTGGPCQRGAAIRCGQAIRITHMTTGRNLHTHHFTSPLSNNQEVSAFGEGGEGDDLDVWAVQCDGQHWARDAAVRFMHVGTQVYLSVTGEQYGHPIRGQREVHAMPSANQHNWWRAMEGVFIQPSAPPLRHDEL